MVLTGSSDPGEFPQTLESSHSSASFSMWSLFLVCYAIAVQSALSCLGRKSFKNGLIFGVFLGGGKDQHAPGCHLGPPSCDCLFMVFVGWG